MAVDADNIPATAVRAIGMLRAIAVALPNGAPITDVNAVGARALVQRPRLT